MVFVSRPNASSSFNLSSYSLCFKSFITSNLFQFLYIYICLKSQCHKLDSIPVEA